MDQWEQLRQQCMSCRACGLADTRDITAGFSAGAGAPPLSAVFSAARPSASPSAVAFFLFIPHSPKIFFLSYSAGVSALVFSIIS